MVQQEIQGLMDKWVAQDPQESQDLKDQTVRQEIQGPMDK
jgi:hypothetical protein